MPHTQFRLLKAAAEGGCEIANRLFARVWQSEALIKKPQVASAAVSSQKKPTGKKNISAKILQADDLPRHSPSQPTQPARFAKKLDIKPLRTNSKKEDSQDTNYEGLSHRSSLCHTSFPLTHLPEIAIQDFSSHGPMDLMLNQPHPNDADWLDQFLEDGIMNTGDKCSRAVTFSCSNEIKTLHPGLVNESRLSKPAHLISNSASQITTVLKSEYSHVDEGIDQIITQVLKNGAKEVEETGMHRKDYTITLHQPLVSQVEQTVYTRPKFPLLLPIWEPEQEEPSIGGPRRLHILPMSKIRPDMLLAYAKELLSSPNMKSKGNIGMLEYLSFILKKCNIDLKYQSTITT
ncbi:unnamed protein product [Protopolystoma xenopodis]|uniref:Uncharacterized protein n=1 Tax=Protopolystoma xenopodis TaxID=117903 RepID=A0A448WEI8_9PLAT|nr:unnamed protein product [Protopolystoma xenopodis]